MRSSSRIPFQKGLTKALPLRRSIKLSLADFGVAGSVHVIAVAVLVAGCRIGRPCEIVLVRGFDMICFSLPRETGMKI